LNPNRGVFTVSVSQKEVKDLNIELFDIFGKSVFKTISNNVNTEINIQNLANGIYLVRLTSNELSEVLKFIKN
jgi:Secretion system C-terminal sorting domain